MRQTGHRWFIFKTFIKLLIAVNPDYLGFTAKITMLTITRS